MIVERKVKLKDNIYYICVELEYRINELGITCLRLKGTENNYFDSGDLSVLIEKIETAYNIEEAKKYDTEILFMGDVLYLYDRIPFLSGVKEAYVSAKENLLDTLFYVSKDEIDKYIQEHNIKMNDNPNFKLFDESTWYV